VAYCYCDSDLVTKGIHVNLELESRKCKAEGCRNTFKVLKTDKALFCCKLCADEPFSGKKFNPSIKKKKKANKQWNRMVNK